MTPELAAELQERCPIKFNSEQLDKLEKSAVMFHEREGKFLKQFYQSHYHMLLDIPEKLKQKYTIIADKYRLAGAGSISIMYELPPAKSKEKLSESLEKVRADYQANLEAKQQQWIEEQIQSLLDEEKAQFVAEAEQKEREFKKSLLDAFKQG
ncbi:hypothetical protein EXA21_16055 [Vibrio cincinnatiensis]|uniref:hypothetical protein n=1 Tax=Vibrio cincinnatiensis TaxID=675 RepID=UPI001EDD8FD6|nr:hypothetical protein [Vibrio cincinnatiensis]MCG3760954.1 hypothetical protein [Vibrio cincinnatiensis]MCG3764279.1 hypothetical protein [Vibrio cincinnatiensis]